MTLRLALALLGSAALTAAPLSASGPRPSPTDHPSAKAAPKPAPAKSPKAAPAKSAKPAAPKAPAPADATVPNASDDFSIDPIAPAPDLFGLPLASLPSEGSTRVADWVVATRDNGNLPFVVIDKVAADLLIFDASGVLLGRAPVLVGTAKGDDSEPGVGDRELSSIPVAQRTTPAGRFLARFGPAQGHKEQVIWVDYVDAISLHPVVTAKPKERRLQRLASATPKDNRITFGCINVDAKLYAQLIEPLFKPAGAVVYILPETRPLPEVFAGLPPGESDLKLPFDEVFDDFRLSKSDRKPPADAKKTKVATSTSFKRT